VGDVDAELLLDPCLLTNGERLGSGEDTRIGRLRKRSSPTSSMKVYREVGYTCTGLGSGGSPLSA
jgi:hypothetical protein